MSVGPMEIIIVLALALLIFGPKRLPEMGRTLGRAAREFRKASDEVKGVLNLNLNDDEDQKAADATAPAAVTTGAPPPTPRHEPWSPGDMAAQDPSASAYSRPGAHAVPGLAGFLGVAAVEPEAAAADVSAAPAFASFLGATAAKTDAEAEAPARAGADDPALTGAGALAGAGAEDPALVVAEPDTFPGPEAPATSGAG